MTRYSRGIIRFTTHQRLHWRSPFELRGSRAIPLLVTINVRFHRKLNDLIVVNWQRCQSKKAICFCSLKVLRQQCIKALLSSSALSSVFIFRFYKKKSGPRATCYASSLQFNVDVILVILFSNKKECFLNAWSEFCDISISMYFINHHASDIYIFIFKRIFSSIIIVIASITNTREIYLELTIIYIYNKIFWVTKLLITSY